MGIMSLVILRPEFQPQLTERANNELYDTDQVQLGAYQDAAPVLDTSLGVRGIPSIMEPTPFEEFTLDHTLEREYQLSTIVWSTLNASNVQVGAYQFPGDLMSKPFIADKIKNFFYLRAGTKISFRVSTNRFTTGSLMVQFVPHGPTTNYDFTGNLYHKSGYEHILLSANQSGTVTYQLPYINPLRYARISDTTPNNFWDVRVWVNDPLVNVNGEQCEVTVEVFAQFEDVRLAVPRTITQSSVSQEAITKSVGAASSVKDAVHPLRAALHTAGSYASYTAAFAGSLSSVAKLAQLGLSKPLSLNFNQKVVADPTSDFNVSHGSSTANTMGMTYENKISTVSMFTKEADEMRLTHLMGTPQMDNKHTFTKATFDANASFNVCATPGVELHASGPRTYVDQVTQMFRYNSGSMKVKVYFFSNSMVKARGVFWISDQPNTNVNDVWEDCYHKVVDIEGDSSVEFSVTYMDYFFSTPRTTNGFFVKFKLLAWSQPFVDAVVPIYMNVYKAAASDFRVDVPRDVMYVVQSNPRFDFSQAFEPMHPSFKSYTHEGLLYGEEYKSVKDCVGRPLPLKSLLKSATVAPNDHIIYDNTGNVANKTYWHVGLWGLFYRYFRGSMET